MEKIKIVYITNKSLMINNKNIKYKLLKQAEKITNINLKIVYSSDINIYLSGDTILCDNLDVNDCDAIIFNDKNVSLAYSLETMGKKIFNSSNSIALCDNKADMYNLMARNNIPFLTTSIVPLTYHYKIDFYKNYINKLVKNLSLPIIAKSFYGAQGKTIIKCNTKNDVINLINSKQGSSLLFQKYDSNCAKENIRMNIIGFKHINSIKRVSLKGEYRTNYAQGATLETYIPSKEEIDLSENIARVFGCSYCGVDIFFSEESKLMVCEINSNAEFIGTYEKTKRNILIDYIEYIKTTLK